MLLLPAAFLRQQQRRPGLQAPGQRAHHHVRPVREQVVHRAVSDRTSPLSWAQEVLLVAAVVGLEDDLLGRLLPVVGDVEEAACVVKQLLLARDRRPVPSTRPRPDTPSCTSQADSGTPPHAPSPGECPRTRRASTTCCLTFSGRRRGLVFTVCFARRTSVFQAFCGRVARQFVERSSWRRCRRQTARPARPSGPSVRSA